MKREKKNGKKINIPVIPIIVVLMFLFGAGVFLYPTVSNYLAEKNSSRKSDEYVSATAGLDDETASREKQKAVEYNEALEGDPVRDPFVEGSGVALPQNYMDVLNIGGMMCTVEIPKINVKLPVYHGTSKEVLDKAVGHIRQTAMPIGGIGNHPVITGHTGLSSAKLFTDLIKLKKGDVFIIHVLKDALYYEVDDISVILPEELSKLNPIPGVDCITLVTCTPYGVNSHRLLVRGARTEKSVDEIEELINVQQSRWYFVKEYLALIIVALFILILITAWIIYLVKSRKKRKREKS